MKIKIIALLALGVAGAGSSLALAAGGGAHERTAPCRRTVVFGTVAAPQSFTVTVGRTWSFGHRGHGNNPAAGKPVQVTMGAAGQTVRFTGVGCVGTDGTVTISGAVLRLDRHPPTTDPPTPAPEPPSTPPTSTDTTPHDD